MPKANLTLNDFSIKAHEVHGNKYQYNGPYINSQIKMPIICPTHGTFHQKPNNHLHGNGCPKCKFDKRRLTLDEFIIRARHIHGNRYEYPGPYINAMKKMPIICHTHGEFYQNANSHLFGCGCPICNTKNGKSSLDEFIIKAHKVHNNKYEYVGQYINARTKTSIVCDVHGAFEQTPDNHLHGQGCPKCAKFSFDYDKPSVVYLLELKNDKEHFIKVGISNNHIRRFRDISSKYPITSKSSFLVSTGKQAKEIENQLLNLKLRKYKPLDNSFKGKTECYELSEKESIADFIQNATNKYI